jgi:hypothetical protein
MEKPEDIKVLWINFLFLEHQGVHEFVGHLSRELPKVTYFKIIIKLYPLINKSYTSKSIRTLYYLYFVLNRY